MFEFQVKPILTIQDITELKKLTKINSKVQKLTNIGLINSQEYHKLGFVLKRINTLIQADASFTLFTHNRFQALLLGLKQLPIKKLTITFQSCHSLDDSILKSLSQTLKRLSFLTSLTLSFTDFSFIRKDPGISKGISILFSKLKTLKFLSSLKIKSYSPNVFNNCYYLKELSSSLENFHSLQILILDFYDFSNINDKGLSSFSKALKKLTNLKKLRFSINNCNASDEGIQSFSMVLRKLSSLSSLALSLEKSKDVKEGGRLESLFLALRDLNSLSALNLNFGSGSTINDEIEDMEALSLGFEYLLSLRVLKLSFQRRPLITNDTIKCLAIGVRCLASLNSLELLFSDCSTIQEIGSFAHSFEKLVELSELKIHVRRCRNIENQEIELFFSSFRHLKSLLDLELKFSNCPFITNSGLKSLFHTFGNFPRLVKLSLDFYFNSNVSDITLETLDLNLERLSSLLSIYLNFGSCCQITDNGVISLASCLQNLESLTSLALDFSQNEQIGEKGIESLISKIADLKSLTQTTLSFVQCQDISKEKLSSICVRLKDSTIIWYNHNQLFQK